jgi:serine/threonine-protein kinase
MYRISVGDSAAAVPEIAEAMRLSPDDSQVMYRAALVYEQSGMRERALQALDAALKGGYSREEIENAPPLQALRQDAGYRRLIDRNSK